MTPAKEPLRFESIKAANEWLAETQSYGYACEGSRGVIVVQLDKDGVWAFASKDEVVLLEEW